METTEAIIDEWTMDTDHDDELGIGSDILAGIETDCDDAEPWQRLGDVLERITVSLEID